MKTRLKRSEYMDTKEAIEEFISNSRNGSLLFLAGFFGGIILNLINWEMGSFVDYTIFFITLIAGFIWIWLSIHYRYACIIYRVHGFVKMEKEEKD